MIFYGRSPNPLDLVKTIRAAVMAHYGEKDPNISKGVPVTAEAMKKYNKPYDYKIYSGALHAFNNDTNKEHYHADAAKEAWGRTEEFLSKHLKS